VIRRNLLWSLLIAGKLLGATVEVAEVTFDQRWLHSEMIRTNLPVWVGGVQQEGGRFTDSPGCWQADSSQPQGIGKLSITLDRQRMQEDLAMSLLYAESTNADMVVQLLDPENRVIVLDVFGNLMAVGHEARTDTFIIPLRKYPTANQIMIRRIAGTVRVYGAVLFPVVTEAEADKRTLTELAKLLGDAISPANPLVRSVGTMAGEQGIKLTWLPSSVKSPRQSTAEETEPIVDNPLDWRFWYVLTFNDDDWGGSPRLAPLIDGDDLVLRGKEVRTRRAFSAPVTVQFDVMLERRTANDGALTFGLVPTSQPIDIDLERWMDMALTYDSAGDRLRVEERFQRWPKIISKAWQTHAFTIQPGKYHHLECQVSKTGTRLFVDGREYSTGGLIVPYDKFYIILSGWQPTNRWHVRNFAVRQ
jgi:hypothetical protein